MKKTAVVTGGSRGIGFAIARKLGLEGYNVAIMALDTIKECREAMDLLEADGTNSLYIQGSVSEEKDRTRLMEETVERYGGIHVLINNAGVAPSVRADLLEMTEESFDRVVGINTKGTLFMSQLVAKQMLKQKYEGAKRGTIINISSISAEVSSVNRGEYCISKAGVSMLTKLFAHRLASDKIYVYEIRPGIIATDMTSTVKEKYDKLIAENVFPIDRWGLPEDVADAVCVFCSDSFLYSTGNSFDIDGGYHIRHL